MRALLATLLLLLASGSQLAAEEKCEGRAREDLELVQKIGSRKAYGVFLGVWKVGPCADLARKQLHEMDPHGFGKPNWGDEHFIQQKIDRQK